LTKTLLFICCCFDGLAPSDYWELLVSFSLSSLDEFQIILFYFVNYSNSFINIFVYALKILEFKQALGLCCFRKQAVINSKGNKKSENRAAKVQNVSHVSMACEQHISMDTSL